MAFAFFLSLSLAAFGSDQDPTCPKKLLDGHFHQAGQSLAAASGRYQPTSEPAVHGLIPAVDSETNEPVWLLLKGDGQSVADFGESVSGYLAASKKGLGPTANFFPEAGLLVVSRPVGRALTALRGSETDFEPILKKIFALLRRLHEASLHHGALAVDSVIVEESGEVSLIGFTHTGSIAGDYASIHRLVTSLPPSFAQSHSHARVAAKLLSFPMAPRYGDKTIETYGPELLETALEMDAKAANQAGRFWQLYQLILEKHSNGTIVQASFSDPVTCSPLFLQSIPSIRKTLQMGWNEISLAVQSGKVSIPEYTRLIEELSYEEPRTDNVAIAPTLTPRRYRTWGTIGAAGAVTTAVVLYYFTPPSEPELRSPAPVQQTLPALESPPAQIPESAPVESLPTGPA